MSVSSVVQEVGCGGHGKLRIFNADLHTRSSQPLDHGQLSILERWVPAKYDASRCGIGAAYYYGLPEKFIEALLCAIKRYPAAELKEHGLMGLELWTDEPPKGEHPPQQVVLLLLVRGWSAYPVFEWTASGDSVLADLENSPPPVARTHRMVELKHARFFAGVAAGFALFTILGDYVTGGTKYVRSDWIRTAPSAAVFLISVMCIIWMIFMRRKSR